MARFLMGRLAKLERRGKRPSIIHNSVARFTPEGQLVGPMPKAKRIMRVTDFGSDAEWSTKPREQQIRLISSAGIQEEGMAQ
ncbi:hypothetical protein [Roseobacter weihaiensis]|uniref:hypothetical protein n=1 Tax=Roseobacter weihaiensis TaxID=2763262 RepID=UPI001D09F7CD|nr:hypothetical protein [Roseobacter sp. H9]